MKVRRATFYVFNGDVLDTLLIVLLDKLLKNVSIPGNFESLCGYPHITWPFRSVCSTTFKGSLQRSLTKEPRGHNKRKYMNFLGAVSV